jgi:ABC-type transport system involved in cytochrome c biogenesis permease subunit
MLGYLVTMRRHRITSLGAFLTPVTLVLFLGAGLQGPLPPVPEHVRSALLPVHVGVNVLGLAAFALAFAAAIAYLVQERLLRSKHVVGVFQRLPALEDLDALGRRLVLIGFPLFTLGVALGTLWATRGAGGISLSTGQGFGMLAWLFFAGVLLLRATGGFSGRRAAIGTMLGFLCAMAALAGYVLRTSGAS